MKFACLSVCMQITFGWWRYLITVPLSWASDIKCAHSVELFSKQHKSRSCFLTFLLWLCSSLLHCLRSWLCSTSFDVTRTVWVFYTSNLHAYRQASELCLNSFFISTTLLSFEQLIHLDCFIWRRVGWWRDGFLVAKPPRVVKKKGITENKRKKKGS